MRELKVVRRPHLSRDSSRRLSRIATLYTTLLFVLLAVIISTGLVVYTAWIHDLRDGLFALVFAILSAQTAMGWFIWWKESADLLDYGRGPR